MLPGLILAAFLLAHGAIHASFLTARPPRAVGAPPWPFDLDRSWLLARLGVSSSVVRSLGIGLVVTVLVAFALAAFAALGWLAADLWTVVVTVGATASIALLVICFHPWLTLGLAIDVVLLWLVLVLGWMPDGVNAQP